MDANEKKNPYEGIEIGDRVEARQEGCNSSPVTGIVIGTELNGKPCLIIDTGERLQQYVADGKYGHARGTEVPVLAYAFGQGCSVDVTKLLP